MANATFVALFTTSGAKTYVAPAAVTAAAVELWGGGGAGANNSGADAGGGGGEYAAELTDTVTAGNSYTLTVGAAGAGNSSGNNGGTGGNTTWTGTGTTAVTAHGGTGGHSNTSGPGGTGSVNTVHFNGGAGGTGFSSSNGGGGGGGSSAGPASAGNAGGNATTTTAGGTAGTAVTGGGPGSVGGFGSTAPNRNSVAPATGPGGGSGGCSDNLSAATGSGFAGQGRVTWSMASPAVLAAATTGGTYTWVCPAGISSVSWTITGTASFDGSTSSSSEAVTAGTAYVITVGASGSLTITWSGGTDANVTGVAASLTVSGGTGTFAGSANVTGVAASLNASGGAGAGSGEAKITGVAASATATGGVGAFSGGANIAGTAAAATVTGGIGTPFGSTPDASVSGTAASATVSGGVGAVAADGKVTPGVAASATVTGGVGTFSGSANIQGVAASMTLSGGVGAAASSAHITGVAGAATVSGGSGLASFSANIQGVAASLTVTGGSGIFSGSAVASFPSAPLGTKVELNINGTWTDVTQYVYFRNPISISDIGRSNETSAIQPGQCTLTLNNRDGRFSPLNTAGAYYPFIQLNTPLRVSVLASSATGFAYNGFRFCGEVSEWPPTADVTNADAYASVTASGIWRRLSRSATNIGSALTRYNRLLSSIAGYWPMEDGSGSPDFAPGILGGSDMTYTGPVPNFSATASFLGSNAIPQLNGAILTGLVTEDVNPGVNRLRFAMLVPAGDGTSGDSGVTAGSVIASLHTTGTVARVDVSLGLNGTGPVTITGFNSGGTQIFTGSASVTVLGVPMEVEVSLSNSGANVAWALNLVLPGGSALYGSASGSVTGSVNDATSVVVNPGGLFMGTAVGQVIIFYSTTTLLASATAVNGFAGEAALTRFTRLCAEQGIASEVIGSSSVAMGPQFDGTFTAVLQTIENSDQGLLYETLDQLGLGYRAYNSMIDQSPAVTLDYSAHTLSSVPTTTYDDQSTANDVTLTNWDGYAFRYQLASGAKSVQAPPNGVGSYPGQSVAVNLDAASEAVGIAQVAKRVLNPGVVNALRVPNLEVNLARPAVSGLFGSIPMTRPGDYLQVTNAPTWLSNSGTSKQVALGYSEVLSNFSWVITYNTVPEDSYESAFSPGTTASGRSTGSTVTGGQAGSISGAELGPGSITPGSLAGYITSASIGGITTSITSVQPVDPNVGDLWIDSGHGDQIKRFDGSTFVPIVFNATNVITAGSITATQIQALTITSALIAAGTIIATNIAAGAITTPLLAAGAVTAANIAAGTVVAGIVNSTTITTATLTSGTIMGGSITGTTVSAATISGGSITGTSISAGTITGGTITGTTISGGSIGGTFSINNGFGTWDSSGIRVTQISVGGTTGTASLEASSLHVSGVAEADGGFQSPSGVFNVTGAGAVSAASLHTAGNCQVDGVMHTNGATWPQATVSTVSGGGTTYNQALMTSYASAINGIIARLQAVGIIS